MSSLAGHIDDFFKSKPIGSIKSAFTNTLYGINHRQVRPALLQNRDLQGLFFIVRPQLNFQSDNLRNMRKLYPLLNDNSLSLQRYIRCMLDPRQMLGYDKVPPIDCPLVDNELAFIPPFTNLIKSCSGWLDSVTELFISKPGLYKESYMQVDSIIDQYNTYDLDFTFRNIRSDPIISLINYWRYYQSYVFQGKLLPYPDFWIENELDYMTRAYRLVLKEDRYHLSKIAATGVSIPISSPNGMFFDFDDSVPYSEQTKEFTIRFKNLGMQIHDDILIKEFNNSVQIFNRAMLDEHREERMVEIPIAWLQYFNHRGYPRIDPDKYTLEWWIKKDVFHRRVDAYLSNKYIFNDRHKDTLREIARGVN